MKNKMATTFGVERRKGLNMTNVVIWVIFALILIQLIGLIFPESVEIALGPIFVLIIAVFAGSAISMGFFKRFFEGRPFSKQDIFMMLLVAGISLLVMFYFRDLVPEIFEQGIVQLQATFVP